VVDPREIALVVGIGGHAATYTTGSDAHRPIGSCDADDQNRRRLWTWRFINPIEGSLSRAVLKLTRVVGVLA
jgi:hypothetical protein